MLLRFSLLRPINCLTEDLLNASVFMTNILRSVKSHQKLQIFLLFIHRNLPEEWWVYHFLTAQLITVVDLLLWGGWNLSLDGLVGGLFRMVLALSVRTTVLVGCVLPFGQGRCRLARTLRQTFPTASGSVPSDWREAITVSSSSRLYLGINLDSLSEFIRWLVHHF